MLSVALTGEFERRLIELAKDRGQTDADLARELIEAAIEDIDDTQMAATRLERRQPPMTSEQALSELGLDD